MIEPILRKAVREEVQNQLRLFHQSSLRSPFDQIETPEGTGLQLRFDCRLPTTIFTHNRIESRDDSPVKFVLFDTASKTIVTHGPISSLRVELFVIDGDFSSGDVKNWSEKDFNDNIVREREGKRPLLIGDLAIPLKDGVGQISDIIFTDNSSWRRSRTFRLGARIIKSTSIGVRIREAISEAFLVKDHRGESYKKHHPPALCDEVWRLERIAKGGVFHKRLASQGINTVQDFLRLYVTDSSSLRNLFHGGISNKIWDIIVEHANSAVDDGKIYMYYPSAQQKVGLLFNSILKVVGVTFNGQNYQSLNKLTFHEKLRVEDLKRLAYKNVKDLIAIDEPSVISRALCFSNQQDEPFISSNLNLPQINFPVTSQAYPEAQMRFDLSSTSSSHTYEAENCTLSKDSDIQNFQGMQFYTPTPPNSSHLGNVFPCPYSGGEIGWPPSSSSAQLATEVNSQVQVPLWSPFTTWDEGNNLILSPSNEVEVGFISSIPSFGMQIPRSGNPKARWFMIWAACKWGISVRRDVAAKRSAGRLPKPTRTALIQF